MENEELEKRLKWYEKRYGPYIEKRGLQNWKNLFRKPTLQEWVIIFMLILSLFIAWAYSRDISECRGVIDECVYFLNNSWNQIHYDNLDPLNVSNDEGYNNSIGLRMYSNLGEVNEVNND